MKAIMRQAKNTVMQFSDIECKVREATSNDSWGASTSQMAEIAKATNDYQEYPQLFAMLWKRLNDVEHIMHVQKALILVEYLLRNGADRFINDAKRRARDIAALKKYKHYDANNQDDAKEARAKAKVVYDMLMDDAKLQEERAKALKIRDVRLTGFGSEGGTRYGGYGGDYEAHERNGGRGASHDDGNGSAGTGTGTVAAPPRRRKDSQDDQDPFDSSVASASTAPARKSTAKDKAAAATTPETEPAKKKKKKKTVAAETEAADNESSEAVPTPKLEAPAQDAKKKKKKKKPATEETKEAADDGDFDDPFSPGQPQPNGQASARYAAAAAASTSTSTSASSGNGRSFVDEFADAVPVAYQQPPQDVDFLTGRPPLQVGTNGDLVDLFSAPNPASPMNSQKLHEISQQPFDPLGRDPNYRASPEPRLLEGPKDLWGATDLMNLNDITKSTAKPAKKLAQQGPTMAQLRAQKPSTTEIPLTNFGGTPSAAPSMAPPPFQQPPVYGAAGAAPMGMGGMGMGMAPAPGMGYPPVHQMGALSLGYPPQGAAYPPAYGYPGYQQAQPQPMLALMPPSAYSSAPAPAPSSGAGFGAPSSHGELPFAVQPGSRPQPAYNSNKPVIFDVVSAQKAAQAQADPHYNYNTSQRGNTARGGAGAGAGPTW